MKRRYFAKAAIAAALLSSLSFQAAGQGPASDKAVLTIALDSGETLRSFTLAELEGLGMSEMITHTPWHPGTPVFSGPLLANVLKAADINDAPELHVFALNDYNAIIPAADLKKWPVLLATRLNGKPLSVRHQGPLFVIYPFDSDSKLQNELYYARSVWQTRTIHVRR